MKPSGNWFTRMLITFLTFIFTPIIQAIVTSAGVMDEAEKGRKTELIGKLDPIRGMLVPVIQKEEGKPYQTVYEILNDIRTAVKGMADKALYAVYINHKGEAYNINALDKICFSVGLITQEVGKRKVSLIDHDALRFVLQTTHDREIDHWDMNLAMFENEGKRPIWDLGRVLLKKSEPGLKSNIEALCTIKVTQSFQMFDRLHSTSLFNVLVLAYLDAVTPYYERHKALQLAKNTQDEVKDKDPGKIPDNEEENKENAPIFDISKPQGVLVN